MTLTVSDTTQAAPRIEFYVTARYTEHPDPLETPRGMWVPSSVSVTKMSRFWADPDENVGAFADRVCAILVARRPLRAQSAAAAVRAREFFRKMAGMKLIFNGRECDESRSMKEYHSPRGMPFLDLEVRGETNL